MVARLETKYEIVIAIAILIIIIFIWTWFSSYDCIKVVCVVFGTVWLNWPTNTLYQNYWNNGLNCILTAKATPAVTNPSIDPLA